MTKVYLVTMHECDEEGKVTLRGKTLIDKVFTNKKLAIAYVNKMNKVHWYWEKTWYWNWETRVITRR